MMLLKSIWTVAWKSLAFIITWSIPLTFFIVPFESRLKQVEQKNPLLSRLYIEFVSAITIIFAAYLFTSLLDRRPFPSLGFATEHVLRDIILGIALGFFWLILSIVILWPCGCVSLNWSNSISLPLLILASTAALLNVVTQEMLTRSYIFQTVQTHFGVTTAIVVSTFFFAVLHIKAINGSWLAALNILEVGALFGIAYVASGNLWLPISIHFAWNCALGPILGLSISGKNPFPVNWQFLKLDGSPTFTGGAFGLEGSIIVTATTIATIIGLLLLYRPLP